MWKAGWRNRCCVRPLRVFRFRKVRPDRSPRQRNTAWQAAQAALWQYISYAYAPSFRRAARKMAGAAAVPGRSIPPCSMGGYIANPLQRLRQTVIPFLPAWQSQPGGRCRQTIMKRGFSRHTRRQRLKQQRLSVGQAYRRQHPKRRSPCRRKRSLSALTRHNGRVVTFERYLPKGHLL